MALESLGKGASASMLAHGQRRHTVIFQIGTIYTILNYGAGQKVQN